MSDKTRVNFTKSDKDFLCSLIAPDADIIKSRDKDNEILKKKKEVWKRIVEDFNSNCDISVRRTEEQLKGLWNNMCNRAKEESAKCKQNKRKTGNNGPPFVDLTVQSQNVSAIIANDIRPLDNPYDGDAEHHGDDVIKLDTEKKEATPSDKKYFIPKRKRLSPSSSSDATEEVLKMRRVEHEAKMEKLKWETAYWRAKYQKEFEQNDSENNVYNTVYYDL